METFRCPLCGAPLSRLEKTFVCARGHAYDVAVSGYVNLLPPGKKNNAKTGDDREMIRARSRFLGGGYYRVFEDALVDLLHEVNAHTVLDAGCGEGTYTCRMGESFPSVIGIDASRTGVDHAAKEAKKRGLSSVAFCVGNLFSLPIADASVDAVVSMFAPVAADEFARVLTENGHLIVGAAGARHLYGLKEAVYDAVYENDAKPPVLQGFVLCETRSVTAEIVLPDRQTIADLFSMTPYYYRTTRADRDKLDALDALKTEIALDLYLYEKETNR